MNKIGKFTNGKLHNSIDNLHNIEYNVIGSKKFFKEVS